MNKSFWITKEIYSILLTDRGKHICKFVDEYGIDKVHDNGETISDHSLPTNATAYLMAGSKLKRKVKILIKLKCTRGCGAMSLISEDEMARGLTEIAKQELQFIGIARVGSFRIENRFNWPRENYYFYDINKLFELSLGRNGLIAETFSKNRYGYYESLKFNVKTVKGVKK